MKRKKIVTEKRWAVLNEDGQVLRDWRGSPYTYRTQREAREANTALVIIRVALTYEVPRA